MCRIQIPEGDGRNSYRAKQPAQTTNEDRVENVIRWLAGVEGRSSYGYDHEGAKERDAAEQRKRILLAAGAYFGITLADANTVVYVDRPAPVGVTS